MPPERRGPQFQLSDGVGCEACHGGAEPWLGTHLSGADHKANLAAGMYPTDQPLARGMRCLSCHLGDDKKFVAHKIMGAGHPPMPFELDTYTAIEPAHFVVNDSYVERKGRPNDMRRSGRSARRFDGQAADGPDPRPEECAEGPRFRSLVARSTLPVLPPLDERAAMAGSTTTGQAAGASIKLYDATAVMLQHRRRSCVAPATVNALSSHLLLHVRRPAS